MTQLALTFTPKARTDTQAGQILAYLQRGGWLTSLEALDLFGCFRLAARIGELRKQGYPIQTHRKTTAGGARVALYSLPPRH